MLSPYRALFLAATVAVCAVVGPRLAAPFAWDDLSVVAYNGRLAAARLPDLFSARYFEVAQEASYRPVSTFLHWAGLQAFGTAPLGHRAMGLALHLLVGALLVAALWRWGTGPDAAYAAGALFLIHPLHLETLFCVAFNEEYWVAFLLLAAWSFRLSWQEKGGRGALAVSAVFFGLSLFAKETALLGLPALWVAERLRPGRKPGPVASWAPYAAAAAVYAVVRFALLPGPAGSDFPVAAPLAMRLYFAGSALDAFLRLLFVPLGLRIEYFAVPPAGLSDAAAAVGGAGAAVALAVWAWRERRREPGLTAGLAWAALLFLPAANLLPAYALTTRAFAERWTYVPMLGLAMALAAFLRGRLASGRALPFLSAVLVFFTGCGLYGASVWSDERRLWARLIEAYPWSAKAHEGLGEARYRAGDAAGALAELSEGLRLRRSREDRLLEYYVPLFESRAAGGPVPLHRETPAVHRWLSRAWLAAGDRGKALEHEQRAAELEAAP